MPITFHNNYRFASVDIYAGDINWSISVGLARLNLTSNFLMEFARMFIIILHGLCSSLEFPTTRESNKLKLFDSHVLETEKTTLHWKTSQAFTHNIVLLCNCYYYTLTLKRQIADLVCQNEDF